MLDGQPRYDSYRDSGIPWLAEIPSEWGIQRAKWLFHKMERPVRSKDDVVTAFRDGQVTLRTNRRMEGFTNAIQEHGYQGIRKGDLVIHAMDAFAGAIGVSESNGKSSPVYAACIARGLFDVSPRYYAYALRYVALSGYILSLAKGIRERSTDFRFKDFGEMSMPVPDLDTQDRIVRFLDEKTAEIDAAIQKKRRLIDLLNEQKAILINRAVTKGLNPNATMKDSGVDWIGEIPAHWDVKRNKNLFKEINNRSEDGREQHLSMSQKLGLVPSNLVEKSLESESYEGAKLVQEGDLVLNRLKAHLAVFSVAPMVGVISPDYSVFRLTIRDAIPSYYESLFKTPAYLGEFNRKVKGIVVGFYRLYSDDFMAIPLIVPPVDEQLKISEHLGRLASEFAPAFQKVDEEISALNEFKQTLIANAVTGKIKI